MLLPPLNEGVPLFYDTDGTFSKDNTSYVEKWNENTICTNKNGMRLLHHAVSHRRTESKCLRCVSYTVTSRELVYQVPTQNRLLADLLFRDCRP